MIVYNIRKSKYALTLKASGSANRWNKNDEFIIYSGSSIALSTLELIAHRSGIDIHSGYSLLFINLKLEASDMEEILLKNLPKNWQSIESYPILQEMGSKWYQSQSSLILKVPSSLVPKEANYLINTAHPDFLKKVSIESVDDFVWDNRLL